MAGRIKQPTGLSVAVLAGGRSRRMGTDKALIPLPPDGTPVLGRVLESARSVASELFIVAPPRPDYLEFGVGLVQERLPGFGPLGGIEAALSAARHERCLVLACDLPLLSASLLRSLSEIPCGGDALVPIGYGEIGDVRRPQPLVAIYARRCLPRVSTLIDGGERRLSALLAQLDVRYVEPDLLEPVDPGLQSFLNLNSPTDLDRLLRLLEDRPHPDSPAR